LAGIRCLIDLETGRWLRLPAQPFGYGPTGFSPDGNSVIHLCQGRHGATAYSLSFWQFSTRHEKLIDVPAKPEIFAISPDGRTVAVGGRFDRGTRDLVFGPLWLQCNDIATGKVLGRTEFGEYMSGWRSLEFSPDGRKLSGICFKVFTGTCTGLCPDTPCAGAWDVPTCTNRLRIDGVTLLGWRADGCLAIQSGDTVTVSHDLKSWRALAYANNFADCDFVYLNGSRNFLLTRKTRTVTPLVEWLKEHLQLKFLSDDLRLADWTCSDSEGHSIASVPGSGFGWSCVSPNGSRMAVTSPDGQAIDLYRLPPSRPGGLVLGLMVVQVALAILWTAWRRRRNSVRIRMN
jgi:hypothetical protein